MDYVWLNTMEYSDLHINFVYCNNKNSCIFILHTHPLFIRHNSIPYKTKSQCRIATKFQVNFQYCSWHCFRSIVFIISMVHGITPRVSSMIDNESYRYILCILEIYVTKRQGYIPFKTPESKFWKICSFCVCLKIQQLIMSASSDLCQQNCNNILYHLFL